jgi:hypothetical protein
MKNGLNEMHGLYDFGGESLTLEIEDGIAVATMNRPERARNPSPPAPISRSSRSRRSRPAKWEPTAR